MTQTPAEPARRCSVNLYLMRHVAASCVCALSIGWLIGIWGGMTSMEPFAARFFPESALSRARGHTASSSNGSSGIASNSSSTTSNSSIAGGSTSSGSTTSSSSGGGAQYCLYNDQLLSLGGSVIYLAALPALAAAAKATHRYGRLPTMWAIAALLAAGAVAGAAARSLPEVFVSRVLLGAAMGCSFQAPTMLLSETLPRARRGAGMYAYNLAMLAGFLVAAVSNQLLQPLPWGWRASAGLMGAPALVLAGLLPFLAESPQALLQRGDGAAAERALRALRPAGQDIAEELSQMKAAADRARARGRGPAPAAPAAPTSGPPAPAAAAPPAATARPHARWRHLPELTASVLYPLVLMASGLNVLSTWMPNLLLALGAGPGVALGGNTVMMVVGLAAALPATFVVERVGRRTLLAAGGATIAASLAALAALLAVHLPAAAGAPPPPASVLPAALALLCINRVALSCTLQPLAATVPAEVQPLEIRSAASALTTAVRNGSSFVVTQFALPLLCATRWGLFAIFAACTAAGALLLLALVPETRGLPLEEVHLVWATHWLWGRAGCAAPAVADAGTSGGVEAAAGGEERC